MKKFFSLLALCCIGMMFLASCEKEKKQDKLPVPQYKELHAKISFDTPELAKYIEGERLPSFIEITSSGCYIANIKRNGKASFVIDKFTVETRSTATFRLNALGATLRVEYDAAGNPTKAAYSSLSGDFNIDVAVSGSGDKIKGTVADDLCRNWKVKNTYISAEGEGLSSGLATTKLFSGADFREMAAYFAENGVNVNPSEFEGYRLERVIFTETGSFVFDFAKDDPYIGAFEVGTNDSFNYNFRVNHKDNPVVGISGNGTVVREEKTLTLNLNTNVTYSGKNYKVQITLEMNPE